MKFLIDEDISPKIAAFLKKLGYSAIHIREIQLSLEDYQILEIAVTKNCVVITEDRDFGELVFKESRIHSGVIFLRLEDQTLNNTWKVLNWLLSKYSERKFEGAFVTVTEKMNKFKARFNK